MMNVHTDTKERMASSTSLKVPFHHQAETLLFMFSILEKQVRTSTILHRKVDAEIVVYVQLRRSVVTAVT